MIVRLVERSGMKSQTGFMKELKLEFCSLYKIKFVGFED